MSPLKLKNPETEQKTKDCLKILNDLKDDLGSWSKVAKRIGVNKVTVIRWINTKVIRECYQNLIPHLYSDERLIENPNSNVLSIDEAFGILNEWHIRYKSWGRISIKIGVPKRTDLPLLVVPTVV